MPKKVKKEICEEVKSVEFVKKPVYGHDTDISRAFRIISNCLRNIRIVFFLFNFTNLPDDSNESLEPARDSHTRDFLIGFIVDKNIIKPHDWVRKYTH